MKFNWGHGLTIFFLLFISTLIFLVVQSRKVDRSLVVDQYYYEDINYQKHKVRLKNTSQLKEPLKITLDSGYIVLQFPPLESISGEVSFYRASDKSKDFQKKIILDEKFRMRQATNSLAKGAWTVKVAWDAKDVPYYTEKQLYIEP